MMRPVLTREEYLALRGSEKQQTTLKAVREGDAEQKRRLLQMNYSCLPNDDGSLKGSTRMSNTVGMDIDFVAPKDLKAEERQTWLKERMAGVPELVLSRKDELGLQMLERSATKGYHLVFRRRPELSQEENLKWASELLGVKFDDKAKDITRVFFTTSASEEDLLYLDDEIFKSEELRTKNEESDIPQTTVNSESNSDSTLLTLNSSLERGFPLSYKGTPYSEIIAKYWELFNDGKEPTDGDRNVLTFELAVTLRSICDYSLEKMMQVIPNYWGDNGEEWR